MSDTRRALLGGFIAPFLLIAGSVSVLADDAPTKPDPNDAKLVERGKLFYAEQCASCHGANLEGQPNWRQRLPNGRVPAPPHDPTGHTWHHSDKQLFDMTKLGPAALLPGYESDMPGFKDKLSDADIWAVLSYIESTWPSEIRARPAAHECRQAIMTRRRRKKSRPFNGRLPLAPAGGTVGYGQTGQPAL